MAKDGLWMWIVHDTVIDVYNTENSEWFGGHCFGKSLKNPAALITTVVEFNSSHVSFPCLLLAVDQDHESLICMFDASTCEVVRSVLVPLKVTSLEIVDGNGGACIETHFLNPVLRCMFGVIAIGSVHGQIYFLDLCLDEEFVCDEKLPNITCVLNKEEFSPQKREHVISKNQHIFICLNGKAIKDGGFEFQGRDSSLSKFPNDYVFVTALKYIRSSATLAVGFSFGGIQLWDLHDFSLQFTVTSGSDEQPTITFAFQEPENDPRNFCYLWIIRGPLKEKQKPQDVSVATLYSLTYFKREYVDSFGFLYIELRSCNKRFEYPMTNDPFMPLQLNPSFGTRLLSCQTISQADVHHDTDAVPGSDSDCSNENMSLCYISWEVWSHSYDYPTAYHMILFDLNQWYQAQMPFCLKCDPSVLSPFFGIFSLREVKQKLDGDALLSLHVIPQSIKKFKYTTVAEEFFFPSSLDFQIISFSEIGVCKGTYLSFQKKLLLEMAEQSPQVVISPKEIYSSLIMSGLVTDIHGGAERVPLISQREMLMQLALEYNLPFFFMQCLKEWRCSDSIHEGCTSKALLNWTWKKLMNIKTSIDKMSVSLFNCSGSDVDKLSLKYLCSYRRQLDLIDTILIGYQKHAMPQTEMRIQDLQCRRDVVSSISIYLQVMLWLRSVHILPEVSEGEETDKNILYPANNLTEYYYNRRIALQRIHSSIGPTDILLIDGLIKETVANNTWQEKGGSDTYPPPSIYAALSCYLLNGISLEMKHALMYYVLLDICHCQSNRSNPVMSEIKKFPSVFGLSQSVVKLIKAYWSLDHKDFASAIKKLLHPLVKTSDIFPWQHDRVIKSFLYQREPQKALRYINFMEPPEKTVEDMKLRLSVLISHGAIDQALEYQRSRQCDDSSFELLNHLFLGCKETRRLKDLMYLPLNLLESSSLTKFLSENEDPCAQEALVMFHLLRCNFFDAVEINEKLSLKVKNKSIPSSNTAQRTVDRNALVERMMSAVPEAEKNLIEEIKNIPASVTRIEESMQPFSINVKCCSFNEIAYSDFLQSLMLKASAAETQSSMEPQTPLRSRNKITFDEIPLIRQPVTPQIMKLSPEVESSFNLPKRTLSSPNLNEFSSPSKKSRLLDNVSFKSTPALARKIPKHLAGDVASLLQSPPIHRRNSKSFNDSMKLSTPKAAPQSILKKTMPASFIPQPDFFTAETPSLSGTEDEKSEEEEVPAMEINDDDADEIPSRQIRFSVPNPSSPAPNTSLDSSSFFKSPENYPLSASVTQPKLEETDAAEPIKLILPEQKDIFGNVSTTKLTREPLKSYVEDGSRSSRIQFDTCTTELNISNDLQSNKSDIHKPEKSFSELHKSANEENLLAKESRISSLQTFMEAHSTPIPVKVADPEYFECDVSKLSPSAAKDPSSFSGSSSYGSALESSPSISPRRPIHFNKQNEDLELPPTHEHHEAYISCSFQSFSDKDLIAADPDVKDTVGKSQIITTDEILNAPTEKPIVDSTLKETSVAPPLKEPSHQSVVDFVDIAEDESAVAPPLKEPSQKSVDFVDIAEDDIADAPMEDLSNPSTIKIDSGFTIPPADECSNQVTIKAADDAKFLDEHSLPSPGTNIGSSRGTVQKSYPRVSFIPPKPKDLHTKTQLLLQELDQLCNRKSSSDFDIKIKRPQRSKYVFTSRLSSKCTSTDVQELSGDPGIGELPSGHSTAGKACSLSICEETYEEFSHALQKDTTEDFGERKCLMEHESSPKVVGMFESSPLGRADHKTFAFSNPVSSEYCAPIDGTVTDNKVISFQFSEPNMESTVIKTPLGEQNDRNIIEKAEDVCDKSGKMSIEINKDQTIVQQGIDLTPVSESSHQKSKKVTSKVSKGRKGKRTQKIEFSFSEPHSPADSKILEALASPPEHPVPTFMFSPPLTRGRLRQKTLDGTLNSSLASITSETSFSSAKKPPIDPLLESIMREKSSMSAQPENASFRKPKASAKKATVRKSRVLQKKQINTAVPSTSSSLLEPVKESSTLETPKNTSPRHSYSTRHSMVLRQSTSGHKDRKLF
ncbi:protein ELYS-like [Uloborus diversus]|uniref:protein ELYS-like n=1 Tax=Uloborus diversus TaxID=327109 RepID=UPI00240A4607|nr:protein ELYS-like [Uloborus diversus]